MNTCIRLLDIPLQLQGGSIIGGRHKGMERKPFNEDHFTNREKILHPSKFGGQVNVAAVNHKDTYKASAVFLISVWVCFI